MKARHLLGISPITNEEIEVKRDTSVNYEEAKLCAVKDYLRNYLCSNEMEIKDMKIVETLVSAKGDNTVYIALDNMDDLKEISMRIAESGNEDLSSHNFIPPQLYERYMAISKSCSEAGKRTLGLKTQIRYGEVDIEVYTKTKGSKDPYKFVELNEVMGDKDLPEFDYSRKWLARREKPPRWKVDYSAAQCSSNRPRPSKHVLSRHSSVRTARKHQGTMRRVKLELKS